MPKKYKIGIQITIIALGIMVAGYLLYSKPSQVDIQTTKTNMFLDSEELIAGKQRIVIYSL